MPEARRLSVSTSRRCEMVDITDSVQKLAAEVEDGYAVVYVPHTTAGVTIQENADPDVQHDLLVKLDRLIPHREDYYRHAEGNSDSHLKAVMTGTSQTVLVEGRKLVLGRWQGVYLCEFDGPRERTVLVKVVDLDRRPRGKSG